MADYICKGRTVRGKGIWPKFKKPLFLDFSSLNNYDKALAALMCAKDIKAAFYRDFHKKGEIRTWQIQQK